MVTGQQHAAPARHATAAWGRHFHTGWVERVLHLSGSGLGTVRRSGNWRAAAAILATACLSGTSGVGPEPPLPDVNRVLFIGNSLTLENDLPLLTQIVAEAGGESLGVRSVLFPGFGLVDHASFGPALSRIREGGWDVVVLQQGPSTLPESGAELVRLSEVFAQEIRAVGALPALLMVWPPSDRAFAFNDGSESYQAAAVAVDGYLFPASQAWLAAWRRDSSLALYSPDDFHPSPLGSVLAALSIYAVLFDRPASELAPTLIPFTDGLPSITLDPEQAAVLFAAADEAVASWGRRPGQTSQ